MNTKTLLQTPPLSLYIHIPWCVRKCPYCDFNSHQADGALDESAYVDALMQDLEQELEYYSQHRVQSLFLGGGTPSLFSAVALGDIISGVRDKLSLAPQCEITMEANPGTVERGRFSDYRSAGINRLSFGIQSFDDDKLSRLGRIHDRAQAVNAIETAQAAGFDNINLDLMFGLPGQTADEAVADASLACAFEPAHISHYQLTIERNTYFYKHTPVLPETDDIWEMQQQCHRILQRHGYAQYEVSAFAREHRQCQHNLNYWTFGDYIGIGAGAHGKSTRVEKQSIQRRWKHRQPAAYIRQVARDGALSGRSELTKADTLFEFLLNALRLREGFSFQLFEQRTGIHRNRLLDACNNIDGDLLVVSDIGLSTSQRGYDFLNVVLETFLDR